MQKERKPELSNRVGLYLLLLKMMHMADRHDSETYQNITELSSVTQQAVLSAQQDFDKYHTKLYLRPSNS